MKKTAPFCYLLNMQKYNKNSWKQKIDPAIDKPVKFYIDFLTQLEKNPNEGRLHFPNDFIEPIIAQSGWQTAYNDDLDPRISQHSLTHKALSTILKWRHVQFYLRAFITEKFCCSDERLCLEIKADPVQMRKSLSRKTPCNRRSNPVAPRPKRVWQLQCLGNTFRKVLHGHIPASPLNSIPLEIRSFAILPINESEDRALPTMASVVHEP